MSTNLPSVGYNSSKCFTINFKERKLTRSVRVAWTVLVFAIFYSKDILLSVFSIFYVN